MPWSTWCWSICTGRVTKARRPTAAPQVCRKSWRGCARNTNGRYCKGPVKKRPLARRWRRFWSVIWGQQRPHPPDQSPTAPVSEAGNSPVLGRILGLRTCRDFTGVNTHGFGHAFARNQLDDPHVRNKRFGQLSKGWQLRHKWWAALRKPLLLLLLDEPFDGLDEHVKPTVFRLLRETVHREKVAVLLVTHHRSEGLEADARHVFELSGGALRLKATGTLQAAIKVDGVNRFAPGRTLSNKELLEMV